MQRCMWYNPFVLSCMEIMWAPINTLTCLDCYIIIPNINSACIWLQYNPWCTCAARLSCMSVYISPLEHLFVMKIMSCTHVALNSVDKKKNFLCDLLWNRSHSMTYPVPIQ